MQTIMLHYYNQGALHEPSQHVQLTVTVDSNLTEAVANWEREHPQYKVVGVSQLSEKLLPPLLHHDTRHRLVA